MSAECWSWGTTSLSGSSGTVSVSWVVRPPDDPPGSAPVPARPVDRPPTLPPALAAVA